MASLPLPLVSSIVALVVGDAATLAQVFHEWHAYARTCVSAEKRRACVLQTDCIVQAMRRRQGLCELRRRLIVRRAYLRELSIDAGRCPIVAVETWCSVLAATPHLTTLSIHVEANCDQVRWLIPLLEAAARLCPNVHALTIQNLWYLVAPTDTTAHCEAVLAALPHCLARWELRTLDVSIPFTRRNDRAMVAEATQYVQAVATVGPSLETLEGITRAHIVGERWHIALDTGALICGSCCRLTSLHWAAVPFATAFFDVFGRYPKLQLTTLTLSPIDSWDWARYHRYLPLLRGGFSATAYCPEVMLAACPMLRELNIQVDTHLDHDDHATDPHALVNRDVFGDAFCETLAARCRYLERFTLVASELGSGVHFPVFERYTGKAMRALATLPALTTVHARSVNISGGGLFVLVFHAPTARRPTPTRRREFVVDVGQQHALALAPDLRFYGVVTQLLTRLANWGADRDDAWATPMLGASNRVVLQLKHGTSTTWPGTRATCGVFGD